MRMFLALTLLCGATLAMAAPVPKELRKSRPTGDPLWKTYAVPSAQAIAERLVQTPPFKGSKVKALIIGNDRMMIYGTPSDHEDVEAYLR